MTRSFTLSQLFALLVVFAACMLVKLWPNPAFFFHDDVQHQYLPVYYEVGRNLLQGRLELESMVTWFGGDLVVEYQYALFNPLALGTYALLPQFDSLVAAATVVGVIWYFVLCVGTYAVVRSKAGHAPALLGVAIIGTNPRWATPDFCGRWKRWMS